jgi:hypothetical protein
MDNAEVYKGLDDIIKLYHMTIIGQLPTEEMNRGAREELNRLEDYRDTMIIKFETALWNDTEQRYEVSLDTDHQVVGTFKWEKLYADAISQLYPMIHGVIEPESKRAKMLYRKFSTYYQWEKMDHMLSEDTQSYWAVLAYASALMKDDKRLDEYLALYEAKVMKEHEKPIYNAEAAWIILACDYMIEYYEKIIN